MTEYVVVHANLVPDSFGRRRLVLEVEGDVIYFDFKRSTAVADYLRWG
jgi:hypothetical protein